MARIRPPRTPRHEDLSITIANQGRQIEVLITRCEELRKERDELGRKVSFYMADMDRLGEENEKLTDKLAAATAVQTRMSGWQDCAREIIGSIDLPLLTIDRG